MWPIPLSEHTGTLKVTTVLKAVTYGCVAAGYATVAQYVGLIASILFCALTALALLLEVRPAVRVPRWALNITSAGVIVFSGRRISADFLIEPIVDALLVLAAIKLLEDKKFRDYMQLYMLCMFLIIGFSLLSFSSLFLIYFTALLVLTTIALVLLAHYSQDEAMSLPIESIKRIAALAFMICAFSIPIGMLLFIILPRTDYPILNFLNRFGTHARSGFTDQVTLGQMSGIQEDNSAIFRAEVKNPIDPRQLYWRGIVLDEFDGKSWKSSGRDTLTASTPPAGEEISQTIYLEPYGEKYLFALDRPVRMSVAVAGRPTLYRHALRDRVYERIRYRAVSIPAASTPEKIGDTDSYLQLPHDFAPSIRNLVEKLTREIAGEEDRLRALGRHLIEGGFSYTLTDLPVSSTPLEDFLLSHKQGNCEFFASSLAIMLRMSGIPARLVAGYRGGSYNDTGHYYLVLQKNAHVWVEAYLAGQGWVRIDPTPSLSRPETTIDTTFAQVRLMLDTFNYYWNKVIINYDFSTQMQMVYALRSTLKRSAELPDIRWKKEYRETLAPVGAGMVAAACLALWLIRRRSSAEERLVAAFLGRMGSRGYNRLSGEGLEELVARIEDPTLREQAGRFVNDFEAAYYRDRPLTRAERDFLRKQLRNL